MLALLAQATGDITTTANDATNGAAATGIVAMIGSFFLIFLIIGLVLLAFNIWMIIDCATKQESDFPSNNKNMWLILLIVGLIFSFGWIVAIIYFFSVKKKAGNNGGSTPANTGGETPAQ